MLSQPRNLDAFEQELAALIGKHFECQPVGLRLNGDVQRYPWERLDAPPPALGYQAKIEIEFHIPEQEPVRPHR